MAKVVIHPNAAARFHLGGRIAWVAGGAGLLGASVCRALAEHGAHVVVTDIRKEEVRSLADSLKSDGLSTESMILDVADEAAVTRCAGEIVNRHGRVDTLVNMAYFYTKTPMDEMTVREWEQGMRV